MHHSCYWLWNIFVNNCQVRQRNIPELNILYNSFLLPFSIVPMMFDSGINFPKSNFEWINLFLLALVCQFGGQFLITFGIGKISPSNGSIGLLMQPLTATILAAFLFLEWLNLAQMIFAAVTLIGIYFARLSIAK